MAFPDFGLGLGKNTGAKQFFIVGEASGNVFNAHGVNRDSGGVFAVCDDCESIRLNAVRVLVGQLLVTVKIARL